MTKLIISGILYLNVKEQMFVSLAGFYRKYEKSLKSYQERVKMKGNLIILVGTCGLSQVLSKERS